MTKFSIRVLMMLMCTATSLTLFACDAAPAIEELNEPLLAEFERDTLQIKTTKDTLVPFTVYIARTDEQMRQGLMYVRNLPAGVGMLFTYRQQRTGSMWMKNTFIPLDILFVDARGQVTDIAKNTKPQSLKSIRSSVKVRGAIELASGSADKFGLEVGNQVIHSHFGRK